MRQNICIVMNRSTLAFVLRAIWHINNNAEHHYVFDVYSVAAINYSCCPFRSDHPLRRDVHKSTSQVC